MNQYTDMLDNASEEEWEHYVWQYVDKCEVEKCWLWKGYVNRWGYPETTWQPKHYRRLSPTPIHRILWWWATGTWPSPTVQLDHWCENKLCVNPHHKAIVTPIGHNLLHGHEADRPYRAHQIWKTG